MSDQDNGRKAIDYFTKEIRDHEQKKSGKIITHEQAEKQAKEIAYRSEKKVIKK